MKEHYELDLETIPELWVLYRHSEDSPYAVTVMESKDINQIFLAMFKDKSMRGNGNSIRIG